MIKPFEDKIDHLVDRIIPYGDAVAPKINRVRPYGKTDPASAPPGYSGPILPAPPHHVTVVSDPAALDEPIVEYSPNAPALVSSESSPNAALSTAYFADPSASYAIGTEVLILSNFGPVVTGEIVTITDLVFNPSLNVTHPKFTQANGNEFFSQPAVPGFGRGNWWEVALNADNPRVQNSPNAPESIYAGYSANAATISVEYSPNAPATQRFDQDPAFVLPNAPNNGHVENYTFPVNERPLVVALQDVGSQLVEGTIYEMHILDTSLTRAQLKRLDGTAAGWHTGRGIKWEVVNNVTLPKVQHSPNAPASIDTQPNAPALIEAEQETVLPGSITVEHSPNAPVIDSAEAYDYTAPYLGLWRFEMAAEKQTDYVAVLVPLAYADDPNIENYPDGFELEILKVQEYMSSVAQGVLDLIKTDDGLIGGTEQAQVFELSDRGISWQYVDLAQVPTPANYSLYRGLARPPVEPASINVEHSPNAVSTVEADTEPSEPALIESGLLANPVQSIDVQTDPYGITSIAVEHSPNAPTIDQILYQEPNPVQSVTAEELFPPNAVSSIDSSILPEPNQVSSVTVEVSPNAPATVVTGHLPGQPAVITANTPPFPVSLVDAQTIPLQPAQVTSIIGAQAPASITADHTPNAPTAISSGELPNAPVVITSQSSVTGSPNSPVSVISEHSPNPPSVDSVAFMQSEPGQPQAITSETVSAPADPVSITSTHNPNAPQAVTSGRFPEAVGQVTAESSPAQPAVVATQQSPNAPQSVTNGLPPLPTGSITVKTGYIGEQRKVTNPWINNTIQVDLGEILTINYISGGNGKRYTREAGGDVWGSDDQYRNNTVPVGVTLAVIDEASVITSRTGDPTGTFAYGTDDHRIYIYNGTSWIYYNSE